jgi:hypothetical protein
VKGRAYLAIDGSCINVVFIIRSGAGIESGRAIGGDGTIAANREATSRRCANITLKLGGGWSEDASAALGVGNLTVVDGIGSLWEATSNAILSVRELADGSGLAP